MNQEIVSALRNAISHGSSLDDAINSYINAGYNPSEVREAAQAVGGGATQFVAVQAPVQSVAPQSPQQQKPVSMPQPPTVPQSPQQVQPLSQVKPQAPTPTAVQQSPQLTPASPQQLPSNPSNFIGAGAEKKETSWLPWIIAYLIVLVLIIAGGFVVWIYFPDIIPTLSPFSP